MCNKCIPKPYVYMVTNNLKPMIGTTARTEKQSWDKFLKDRNIAERMYTKEKWAEKGYGVIRFELRPGTNHKNYLDMMAKMIENVASGKKRDN